MLKRNILDEKDLSEIKKARKENKDKNVERRLKALELRCEGKKYKEISHETSFALSYVGRLIKKYIDGGLEAITENHYGGNHRLLNLEEEYELLEPFMEQAKAGQLIEVSEIKKAYEKAIGRELNSDGHIYQVLKRHNFRKVMPRSQHPNKASDEVIHITKKLKQPARK